MSARIVIVGGHGKISLRLANLLSPTYKVISIIRSSEQEAAISAAGATPLILSLEDSPVSDFTNVFAGTKVVYFSAGAGGKGGEERTKKVDYGGAIKVFDAIEAVVGEKPRLILVSAIDIRDENIIPSHYNEEDIALSKRVRGAIAIYMKWKYEADKNLVARDKFKWTIVRPTGLTDSPGTGKAEIGITHLSPMIARDDVAKMLAALVDRDDAAGLALDIVGGEVSIEEGVDKAVKNGKTAWVG